MNSIQNISCFFTHHGQRAQNEDFYIADDDNSIYILTDGMGGYIGGEVAGRIAAHACHDYIKKYLGDQVDSDELLDFIRIKMKEAIRINPIYASMGATLCCVYIHEGFINAIHIGDSKIILVTDSIYASSDHTYAQYLIDHHIISVDEYQHHPLRHILTRCITGNTQEKFKADFCKIPLQNGLNTFFLCSDGVLETYSASETIRLIKAEPDIYKLLRTIEQNTLKYSKDNATAILVGFNYSINGN